MSLLHFNCGCCLSASERIQIDWSMQLIDDAPQGWRATLQWGLIYTNGLVEPLKSLLSIPAHWNCLCAATAASSPLASASSPGNLLWNAMEDQWNCNGRSDTHWSLCCLWPESITCRYKSGCKRWDNQHNSDDVLFSRRLSIRWWLWEPRKRSITNLKGRSWWLKKKRRRKKLFGCFGRVKVSICWRGALKNLKKSGVVSLFDLFLQLFKWIFHIKGGSSKEYWIPIWSRRMFLFTLCFSMIVSFGFKQEQSFIYFFKSSQVAQN